MEFKKKTKKIVVIIRFLNDDIFHIVYAKREHFCRIKLNNNLSLGDNNTNSVSRATKINTQYYQYDRSLIF